MQSQGFSGLCGATLPFAGGDLTCSLREGHDSVHLGATTDGGGGRRSLAWSSAEAETLHSRIAEAEVYFLGEARSLARLEVLGGGFVSKVRAAVEGKGSPGIGSRAQRRANVKPGRGRR